MSDTITLTIPVDLAESIALAIEQRAEWFRNDDGHGPEGIDDLRLYAKRLDAVAESIWQACEPKDSTPDERDATQDLLDKVGVFDVSHSTERELLTIIRKLCEAMIDAGLGEDA